MNAKRMRKMIQQGSQEVKATWKLDSSLLGDYLREQAGSDRREAIRHSMILPVIFFIILVVQTRGEDFSSGAAFWDYFRFTFGFPFMFFVLVFPLLSLTHWIKRKRLKNAAEAFFGEDWILFGHIFHRWKGDTELKGVYHDEKRTPKIIGFDLSMRPTGKGRVRRRYEIPIPDSEMPQALALEKYYNERLN